MHTRGRGGVVGRSSAVCRGTTGYEPDAPGRYFLSRAEK